MKKIVSLLTIVSLPLICFSQINIDSQNKIGIRTASPSSVDVYISGSTKVSGTSMIVGNMEVRPPSYFDHTLHIKSNNGYTTDIYPSESLFMDLGLSTKKFEDVYAGSLHGTLIGSSDISVKENITSVSGSLSKLISLNAISFDYKKEYFYDSDFNYNVDTKYLDKIEKKRKDHVGFSAQEVQQLFPELVEEQEDGILGVKYVELIPHIIEALKEQNTEIEHLKNQIQALQEEIDKAKIIK